MTRRGLLGLLAAAPLAALGVTADSARPRYQALGWEDNLFGQMQAFQCASFAFGPMPAAFNREYDRVTGEMGS